MDKSKLRAWWFHKQGLDGSLRGQPVGTVLERTGWSRSVGGANPYLALFSRCGASREQVDQAVAMGEIHELPSARGCTYVLPRRDYAVGLTVGQGFGDQSDLATASKHFGTTVADIDRLGEKVLQALTEGSLEPKAIRERLGDQIRSFGEEGRKRGLTSDLPIALGRLQSQGRIRRVPLNGRLDNQRYAYALWQDGPFADGPLDREEALRQLALRYFAWIGPATLKEFQWLSGLGVKASKETIDGLGLVTSDGEWFMHPDDVDAFDRFETPKDPSYALVGCLDNLTHLRLGLPDLIDGADAGRTVPGEKSLLDLTGLSELVSHGIYDRGRLIGVWDFDPESSTLVSQLWAPVDETLTCLIARTEAYVRDELGDARTFSLDSPKSRKPRLAMLRG